MCYFYDSYMLIMSFKIGDKVSFIDENFEAVIKEIISDNILIVEDEHGFDRRCSSREIVLVEDNKYKDIEVDFYKDDRIDKKKNTTKKNKHIPVADLHMENLLDTHKHMSNHEIVMFQTDYCRKKIDGYLKRGIREFIIVHGIGTGKLKAEVRYILNSYPKLEYMDDHVGGYGVGATRVFVV